MQVARAIKAYQIENSAGGELARQEHIEMELARLDAWMAETWEILDAEHWKYDKDGVALEPDYTAKLKVVETLLKISKQRVDLLGLTELDPMSQQATALVIQTATYVEDLKAVVLEQQKH